MRATCLEVLNGDAFFVRARKAWMILSDSHLSSVGEFDRRLMSLAVMVMPVTCCWGMGALFGSW